MREMHSNGVGFVEMHFLNISVLLCVSFRLEFFICSVMLFFTRWAIGVLKKAILKKTMQLLAHSRS